METFTEISNDIFSDEQIHPFLSGISNDIMNDNEKDQDTENKPSLKFIRKSLQVYIKDRFHLKPETQQTIQKRATVVYNHGASMFVYLESRNEIKIHFHMDYERKKCICDLWNYTISVNVSYPDLWKRLALKRIEQFEETIIKAVQKDGHTSADVEQWSFSSVTVITTIGYGIQITFLNLANLGNLMAKAFRFGYQHICCDRCFFSLQSKKKNKMIFKMNSIDRTKHVPFLYQELNGLDTANLFHSHSNEMNDQSWIMEKQIRNSVTMIDSFDRYYFTTRLMTTEFGKDFINQNSFMNETHDYDRVPICMVICVVIGYITLGTLMFYFWEDWTPIEGAYFCFTLITIGFEDLVPGSVRFSSHKDGQTKFIICVFT